MGKLIGREKQRELLREALDSDKSELVVVYGRRRVGKTYLIRETYHKYLTFEVSGIPDGTYQQQLRNFHAELCLRKKSFMKRAVPTNWLEAFYLLSEYLDGLKGKNKKVLFIDEFPWMYTHKSKFVQLFGHFWNTYCSKRKDLVVVICGSAASFMVKQVIRDRKGLHNRITLPIRLAPFNLYETDLFLKSRKIKLDHYSCIQLYMAIGGIPHYLDKIKPGDSVPVAIDRLCFEEDGLLVNEFDQVFASLFEQSDNHKKIVEALAGTQRGMTRGQLVSKSGIPSGGTLTKTLAELTESGFISAYYPFLNNTKETLYRLTDEYALFYLKYIRNNRGQSWKTLYQSRSYSSWSGFAFENLCLKHSKQLLAALGIGGISARLSSWRNAHAQIDLLIVRDDHTINLCEMKFSESPFSISKSYADDIRNKKREFMIHLKKRKNIVQTFVTTYGVKQNTHSQLVMDNQITMNKLFIKE